MRVLLDVRTLQDHFPGIGRYVFNLAKALAPQLDGELVLLTLPRATNTRFDLADLGRHPNVHLHPTAIPVFHWREQTDLPRLIHRLQPDVVHFPYNVRPFALDLPSLLTLYDAIPRRYPGYYSRVNRLRIETIQRLALRASHSFVAISQATADDFARLYGVSTHRITVTPLAADPIFQPQPAAAIADLRRRLALPDRYLLYLGSNKPHKNLPRLIEAYHRLIASPDDAKRRGSEEAMKDASSSPASSSPPRLLASLPPLLIAGSWDDRHPEPRQLVARLGLTDFVRFLGPVANADLPALYAGAEVFVFPSVCEGFGLPVLEAMACGSPVLCSNTSSLPEVAGDAALLFDPTDVGAIVSALGRVLAAANLRIELRQRGLEQAARFTWQRTAAATLAAYRQALADR